MAPGSDYLFLSIETVVNTLSMVAMIPCLSTLLRTQGIHGNCKALLFTSALIQSLLLFVQTVLFAHNFITENLRPVDDKKEMPFLILQNGLFVMSCYMSMIIVLERTFAVWNAARYERIGRHNIPLIILIGGCLVMACLTVYAIYWHDWYMESLAMLYGIDGFTLVVSIIIMVYARRKFASIPFNRDYLKAKYQVKEVLNFSFSLLPSVMVSALMHTLSLVPTLLWVNGIIDYPFCCLFYFSAHSLNGPLTKLTLIAFHRHMRQRFQLLFVSRLATRPGARIHVRNYEEEGRNHFKRMKEEWENAHMKLERIKMQESKF